jgi:hypothetical protein
MIIFRLPLAYLIGPLKHLVMLDYASVGQESFAHNIITDFFVSVFPGAAKNS